MEGRSIMKPPYFDHDETNFINWKKHMQIFIQSLDFKLWLVIKNGPKIPKKIVYGRQVEKSEDEYNDEDMKNMEQESKAKNILYCAMSPEAFERVSSNCTTAKQIWDKLDEEMRRDEDNRMTLLQPNHTRVNSDQFNSPIEDFLEDTRAGIDIYLTLCVPLHKLTLEGNWQAAKQILDKDPRLKHAAITRGLGTVLHVAAGASGSERHLHFVQELMALLDQEPDQLSNTLLLQDYKGNTAFCFAAAAGNMQIVKLMLDKNGLLPTIRGGGGATPAQFAALQGRPQMARFLYIESKEVFQREDYELLFFACINTGNYGLALELANERPELAFARESEQKETALHLLAQKPLDSSGRNQEHHFPIQMINPGMKQRVDLQLVKFLWDTILRRINTINDIPDIINDPYQFLFVAAEVGNVGFLSELISAYPSMIWVLEDRDRSIIHIAVMNRQAEIYNLILEIGAQKDIIVTYVDNTNNNTLLHLAAQIAPPSRLELLSGAAFQMCLELHWFEEVKKIVLPSFIKMKNSEGLTASELFTKEHAELRKDAESWMKSTAENCMLISTVIATGVFSAGINIPGGISDSTGTPNYLEKTAFLVFAISDAAAFILSVAAIFVFWSIIVSRYAEYDFYKSLPRKLICGLVTLFFSITSMMIAFSSAFFITYFHGLKLIPGFIAAFACVPVIVFVVLQYSLLSEIMYSTYHIKNLFKPGKRMLYVPSVDWESRGNDVIINVHQL